MDPVPPLANSSLSAICSFEVWYTPEWGVFTIVVNLLYILQPMLDGHHCFLFWLKILEPTLWKERMCQIEHRLRLIILQLRVIFLHAYNNSKRHKQDWNQLKKKCRQNNWRSSVANSMGMWMGKRAKVHFTVCATHTNFRKRNSICLWENNNTISHPAKSTEEKSICSISDKCENRIEKSSNITAEKNEDSEIELDPEEEVVQEEEGRNVFSVGQKLVLMDPHQKTKNWIS